MVILLAVCFGLLAIVAGMLLLAKTKKDDLGLFFKIVSWFVIFVAFYATFGAIHGTIRVHQMMKDKIENGKCKPGEMMGCHMEKHCWMKGDDDDMMCGKHNEGCCKHEEKEMGCGHGMGMGMPGEGCKGMKSGGFEMENMTPEQKTDAAMKMLTEKLKLTAEQTPKVHDIILKSVKDKQMMMKDASGDKEKCEKACGKICQDKLDALKKVLTPEQFKNLPECCMKKCGH